MAKKNKVKGKKGAKKSGSSGSGSGKEILSGKKDQNEYQFDEETLALAGGNTDLVQRIRDMIAGMDDKGLEECMELLQDGALTVDQVWDMILQNGDGVADGNVNVNHTPDAGTNVNTNGTNSQLVFDDNANDVIRSNPNGHRKPLNVFDRMTYLGTERIPGLAEDEDEEDERYEDEGGFEEEHEGIGSGELEGKEYSINLELPHSFFNPYKLHDALFKVLRISRASEAHKSQRIYDLFTSMAVLCDPYTQPSDSGVANEMILSADLVSDLIISVMFGRYIDERNGVADDVAIFNMAFDIAQIITNISTVLNVDDESVLMYVNNDASNWEKELYKWLPQDTFSNMTNIASDYHHMMLLYTIMVAGLLTISKLYAKAGSVCMNPFLSLYLQLWKNHSRVIFLGIEIDCRDEQNGFPGYPEVIRYVIKGSSAVRSMISLILNQEFVRREHDLRHESLINFMRPWGRKFSNGSIKVDMRIFVAALLALGSELDGVTELLFGFEPEDRYDEDLKYMFEMELEDMEAGAGTGADGNEDEDGGDDDDDGEEDDGYEGEEAGNDDVRRQYIGDNIVLEIEREDEGDNDGGVDEGDEEGEMKKMMEERKMVTSMYDLHPSCECDFEDFESDSDYDEEEIEFVQPNNFEEMGKEGVDPDSKTEINVDVLRNINNGPSAVRQKPVISEPSIRGDERVLSELKGPVFDSKGRDWRDIPRGTNMVLTESFVDLLKKSVTDADIFITPIDNLLAEMDKMSKATLDSKVCEKIIKSVAWVVQYERESMSMKQLRESSTSGSEDVEIESDESINSDVLYNFLKSEDKFEKMVRYNPSCAFSIIDELFMATGYRRVLIWFLAHLPLNHWIINYFHDLLVGNRGNVDDAETNVFASSSSPSSLRFWFSRVGCVELSEVEKSMLLHEFLSNAAIFLSRGPDPNNSGEGMNRLEAQRLVKVICLMLKSLEYHGVLSSDEGRDKNGSDYEDEGEGEGEDGEEDGEKEDDDDDNREEYRLAIQMLLVSWIGVSGLPEARELFFKYKPRPEKKRKNKKKKNTSIENGESSSISNAGKNVSDGVGEKLVNNEKVEKIENDEKVENGYDVGKMNKIFSVLKNFGRHDVFMMLVNLAVHYKDDGDFDNVANREHYMKIGVPEPPKDMHYRFMIDLNNQSGVYDDSEELRKEWDIFFTLLRKGLAKGDVEFVARLAQPVVGNDDNVSERKSVERGEFAELARSFLKAYKGK